MKHVILMKKKGYKRLTQARRQKPWKIWGRKWQKLALDWIDRERIEKRVFEEFWKVWRTREKTVFKTLTSRFSISRKLASIDQKLNSINRVRRIVTKNFISFSIDRETTSINRKSGKLKFLKIPQSTVFHEWIAWVWD